METGRLPSVLGREFFRTHVTSHSLSSFEDVVIFVHACSLPFRRSQSTPQRSQYFSSTCSHESSVLLMIAPPGRYTAKKPCAGFPDTGLVSLTMTCLDYVVMNAMKTVPTGVSRSRTPSPILSL
jgi:hypothetical protein